MAISNLVDATAVADRDKTEIAAPAWSAAAYLNLGSQYVYRGVAQRDDVALSAELSLTHRSGWFIDTWAGRVDAAAGYEQPRHGEWLFDTDIGYGAQIAPAWQWSLSRAWIAAVDSHLPESQNYQEWRANLFYREHVSLQIAYAENYRQLDWGVWNAELRGQEVLTDIFSGEWGVGHSHFQSSPEFAYSYGWVGLQTDWLDARWRLRWIYSGDEARYVQGDDRRGGRIELSARWYLSIIQ